MKTKAILLQTAILLGMFITPASHALAPEPAYGQGITVDGDPGDWDLADDFFAEMYNGGRPTPGWSGYAVLSHLYLRYDCEENLLCALVLDVAGDGRTPNASPGDAWIKLYGIGLPGSKLIDGNGEGGTTPRGFQWVYATPGDPTSTLVGYEAYARLDEGIYAEFEAHLNIDGATSSTGKRSQGYAIPLIVHCVPDEPVDAGEPAQFHILRQNHPNPFNPATTIRFTLGETGPVRLTVSDLLGRQVAVLSDGLQAAGEHAFSFNAAGLASGVYIYRLETERGTLSRRMILTK